MLAIVLAPALAQAHAVMLDPPPRDPNQIKIFPCGGAGPTPAGSSLRTTLQAGSTITVEFAETVQHPGYFRIAFSPDGLTGFDQHVLVPMIADTNGSHYTAQVQLPSTPCDNCSLQLIQCMDGAMPPVASCSNYYSCSDLVLTAGPGGGGGGADASVPGGGPGPGAPDAGGGGPGGDPDPGAADPGVTGACAIGMPGRPEAGNGGPWLGMLLVGVGVVAGMRRARRRG